MADNRKRRRTHPDKAAEALIRSADSAAALLGAAEAAAKHLQPLAGIDEILRASEAVRAPTGLDHLMRAADATRTIGPPAVADYLARLAEAGSTAGLRAIDESISRAVQDWQARLVGAQNLTKTAAAISASISEAIAARQTYLSDPLANLRSAGLDTNLGITGSAAYLTQMNRDLAEPYRQLVRQAALTRNAFVHSFRPAALAASLDWGRRARELDEHQRQFAAELQRDGWWFVPSWPMSLPGRLVALRHAQGKRALDRAVCEIYSHGNHVGLRRMVERWMDQPAFRARRPIIHEALALHRQRRFRSSIPTLLPHVEGVVVDTFAPASQRVDPVKLLKAGVDPARLHSLLVDGLVATLEVMYGFQPFGMASRRSRRLNRHLILHGRVTSYGSEANSLKVFLLLDVLASEARARHDTDASNGVA